MPITECSKCGEPFHFGEAGAGGWGSREREDIDCPHCGKVHGRQVTAGHFESSKLTDEQLAAYRAENPKREG